MAENTECLNRDELSTARFAGPYAISGRWMCWFGLHDWLVLKMETKAEVDYDVACELDPLGDGEIRACCMSLDCLVNKVCLRCGKAVDQIAIYHARRKIRMSQVVARFGLSAIQPKKYPKRWS